MLHRLALLAVASFFCLASASTAPQQPANQGYNNGYQQAPQGYQQAPQGQTVGYNQPSTGGSEWVSVKTTLDSDSDAIGIFQVAAQNKGCSSERADTDGYRVLVVNCSDGSVIVAQQGRELMIGCKAAAFTQDQCSTFAVNLLEYAKTGGGSAPNNNGGGAGFGGGGGGAGFGQ